MAEVVFKNIVKRYGPVEVVKNLSLAIHDGEFLVLVGASGCGKSTTLRLLAGLEETDSGEIYIGDKLVNHLPPKDRDIAMVFQNYALYPHMTVYDNIAFGLKMRRVPKAEIEPKVQEAAQMLGITEYLQRRPKQLSGGQRQRVALARALVRRPQAFLMDEPLSNLDAKLRAQTRTEIKKLHQRLQTTTIYVTHDQVEAMTMGDRIAVMKDGIIQQLASPLETYDFPANLFVAGFIGSPAMNFLPVHVTAHGDGKVAVEGSGFNLKLPCPDDQTIAPFQGQEVKLGVRPEHISLVGADQPADAIAKIEVVEPSGPRTLLHLRIGELPVVAEVETAQLNLTGGGEARLKVEAGKLHLFDSASHTTILSTQRALAKV